MFDRLKSLFSKREERPAAAPTAPAPAAPPPAPKKEAPAAPVPASAAAAKPAPAAASGPAPKPAATGGAPGGTPGETIPIHLKSILARLPEPLKDQVAHAPGAQVTIPVAVNQVTAQLAHGAVKIAFAELRALAPAGTFKEVEGQDQTMVDLPLQEVLAQLKPTHLQRRAGQKKIEVSEEITALFGAKGEPLAGLKVGSGDSLKPAAPAAPPAAAAPTAPTAAPAAAKPAAAPSGPAAQPTIPAPPAPKAEPAAALKPSISLPDPASLKPAAPTPAAPVKAETKLPDPASLRPTPAAPSAVPRPPGLSGAGLPPLPKPAAPAPPGAALPRPGPTPPPPSPGLPKPPPPPAPKPAAGIPPAPPLPKSVAPPAAPTSAPAPSSQPTTPISPIKPASSQPAQPVVVVLEEIVPSFPENVRAVATEKRTPGLRFRLPAAEVDAGLKRGKVSFTWKQLKPFADPPIDANLGTECDDTEVELPLSLIAPLFLAQNKPARPQKKVTVGDNIPDLFGPKPGAAPAPAPAAAAAAAAAPAPAAAPAVAPAPVPVAPAAPPPPPPKPNPLGVLFGLPSKYEWTVEEVVQHTAKLAGVSAAWMASKDGLMIASKLAGGQNGETLAAFVPQAFGRMSQYAGDMQLGTLKVITLHTERFVVEIHQIGDIYFAVAVAAGQTLPSASLQTVAQHFSAARQS